MKKSVAKKISISLLAVQLFSVTSYSLAAPSQVMGYKSIRKWDYHKSHYDKNGRIRISPEKTTFDTSKKVILDKSPKLYAGETKHGEDVVIKVEKGHKDSRTWIDSIYRITRVASLNGDNPATESDIEYSFDGDKIILKGKSRAIDFNGLHTIKIYSKDFDTRKMDIHIVEKGSINIHPDFRPVEGKDLLLVLEDFNYRIENPVYEVLVDDVVLNRDNDEYHVVSNVIRIKKGGLNYLKEGRHTVKVRAYGYEDFIKSFIVDGRRQNNILSMNSLASVENKDVQVMASASKLPPKKESEGVDATTSATGSLDQNVDLLFDFDLVANALILKELGLETENSRDVLDVWYSAKKTSAIGKDRNKAVSWIDYTNKVIDKKYNGDHITFEDYLESSDVKLDLNRGYNYKNVLEDGLLGEVQSYDQATKEKYKGLKELTIKHGEALEIEFDNLDFIESMSKIIVNHNQLAKKEYRVDGNKLIIENKRFNPGKNSLVLFSNTYKDEIVEFEYLKTVAKPTIYKDKQENIIISGLEEGYLKNFKGISLNSRGLFSDESMGKQNSYDYRIEGDKIVVLKEAIGGYGRYNIGLKSYGHQDILETFVYSEEIGEEDPIEKEEEEKPDVDVDLKTLPKFVLEDKSGQGASTQVLNSDIKIKLGNILSEENTVLYEKLQKSGKVYLNDKEVEVEYKIEGALLAEYKAIIPAKYINQAGKLDIRIELEGYKSTLIECNIQGSGSNTDKEDPIEKEEEEKPDVDVDLKTLPKFILEDKSGQGASTQSKEKGIVIRLGGTFTSGMDKIYEDVKSKGKVYLNGEEIEVEFTIDSRGLPTYIIKISGDKLEKDKDYKLKLRIEGYKNYDYDYDFKVI